MILDLSINGKLELNEALLLNQITEENRKAYIDFIAKLSEPHNLNLDWWADEPVGRNTLTDPLFYYICRIELLKKIIQSKKNIDEIIIDSKSLKKIVKNILKSENLNSKITFKSTYINKLKNFLRSIYNIFSVILYYSAQFYFAKKNIN